MVNECGLCENCCGGMHGEQLNAFFMSLEWSEVECKRV